MFSTFTSFTKPQKTLSKMASNQPQKREGKQEGKRQEAGEASSRSGKPIVKKTLAHRQEEGYSSTRT